MKAGGDGVMVLTFHWNLVAKVANALQTECNVVESLSGWCLT